MRGWVSGHGTTLLLAALRSFVGRWAQGGSDPPRRAAVELTAPLTPGAVRAYRAERPARDDDRRAIMLNGLDDPPPELAELRAVLLADDQWRRSEGLE